MSHFHWIIVYGFLLLCSPVAFAEDEVPVEVAGVPFEYELFIKTEMDHYRDTTDPDLRYTGRVKIELQLANAPKDQKFFFAVNVDNQTIVEDVKLFGRVFSSITQTHEIPNVAYVHKEGFLNITCNGADTEKYNLFQLVVSFSNPFRNDMSGFYRSSYKVNGKNRWVLTTHFQPIYARRAFPCFDKPPLKARVAINIAIPEVLDEYNVLCNGKAHEDKVESGYRHVQCQKTPLPMSTYLIAFTVSDYAKTKDVTFDSNYPSDSPRTIAVHGRKNLIERGDGEIAQRAALDAVGLLGKWLEKGYAFDKIDQVGIPDFSFSAMENWGLILFREKSLFVNQQKSTTATKQSNVLTVTHELVHQWFGNLVTLESWNYIWLNEAFATYLSYVIGSQLEMAASWNYMDQALVKEVHSAAMETDGVESSPPLSQNIQDESLFSSAFNDIPYAKGASVLRMWDLSLPENKFRESLVYYIKKNKELHVSPEDLYDAFKTVAGMEEEFFNSWHQQPGYPVVEVRKDGNVYTLTQHRFLWEKQPTSRKGTTYYVPVSYTTSDVKDFSTKPQFWLTDKEYKLNITSKWFVLNNKQAGYYKVNYNPENWQALTLALREKHTRFPELTRAQLVNDVLTLARSVQKEYVNYSTALELTRYMAAEKSYVVWNTALKAFEFLETKLSQNQDLYSEFRKYVLDILTPHYKGLGAVGENHLENLLSSEISRWACALEYSECVSQAKELFPSASQYPDTEQVILCTVARHNETVWNEIFRLYESEGDSSRKNMYLQVLGCTTDSEKAEGYLNYTLKKDSGIRKQDRTLALSSVYNGGSKNLEIALKFVENNFELISTQYGGINPLGKAITGLARRLYTDEHLKRMEKLVGKIKENSAVKVSKENLEGALRVLQSNQNWIKEKNKELRSALSSGSAAGYSLAVLLVCSLLSSSVSGA